MKKIMSLITMMSMLSNVALAGQVNENIDLHSKMIGKVFNEFRYKMTVEVNPNELNFQEKATAEFKQKLSNLESQGVSAAEIMNYMRASVLDSATRTEFDRMVNSIDTDKVSAEEAGNLAMKFMNSKYQQGASYSGGGQGSYKWVMLVVGVVIVGVATYFIIKHIQNCKNKTDTKTETNTQTNTETATETTTDTVTDTVTDTNTDTNTNTDYGYCCNYVSGHVVPASPTGCTNGEALVFVTSPSLCIKLGPPSIQ
jgi:hypothetical protein